MDRSELDNLVEALAKPGTLMVVGQKGVGKSGLVKMALSQCPREAYLFFRSTDIIENQVLRDRIQTLFKEWKESGKAPAISTLVIDSAEDLFGSKSRSGITQELLASLPEKCKVVFTITPEALANFPEDFSYETLHISPLDETVLLKQIPALVPYSSIKPLMQLAKIPFHLKVITKLLTKMEGNQFQALAEKGQQNLEWELIKLVIEGSNPSRAQLRRTVWHQVTRNSKVTALSYLAELETEGVVIKINDRHRLSHDLFEEWGFIDFCTEQWFAAYSKNLLDDFWSKFPSYLHFPSSLPIFVKWLSIYARLHREAFQIEVMRSLDPSILKQRGLTIYHIALSFICEEIKELLFQSSPSDQPTIQEFVEKLDEPDKLELEEFTIGLVQRLNDGTLRTREKLTELMSLIKHRAKISEFEGLDFYDQESQLSYMLEPSNPDVTVENIFALTPFILEDSDRMDNVLKSDYGIGLRGIILEEWFKEPTQEQLENLATYAKEHDDADLINQLLGYYLEKELPLSFVEDLILADSKWIAKVLNSDYGQRIRSVLITEWLRGATDKVRENLKQYAENNQLKDLLEKLC